MKRVVALVIVLMLGVVAIAEQSAGDFLRERGMSGITADDLESLGVDVGRIENVDYKICALIEVPDVGCYMLVYDGTNEVFVVNWVEILTGISRNGGTKQVFRDFSRAYNFDIYIYQCAERYDFYISNEKIKSALNADFGQPEYTLHKTMNEFLGSF